MWQKLKAALAKAIGFSVFCLLVSGLLVSLLVVLYILLWTIAMARGKPFF